MNQKFLVSSRGLKKNECCSLQYEKRSLVKMVIESFEFMTIAHQINAPVAFSSIQIVVRTQKNHKPNRKAMKLDRDRKLIFNLISTLTLPSPSSSPSAASISGEEVSREHLLEEQVCGKYLAGMQQSCYRIVRFVNKKLLFLIEYKNKNILIKGKL
jgi:hypothetical protein